MMILTTVLKHFGRESWNFVTFNINLSGFYPLVGGGGASFPPKKSFPEKKLKPFQIKIFFDDDFRELVKVTNVQKCDFSQSWTLYFQNISGGACPRTPLEGLKKFFLAAAWLKNFFPDRLLSKQKILDRTLSMERKKKLFWVP